MARYNEILVGRYNRWLQKLLQLKGDAPAPQLAGEIQPSILYPSGVEERYLQGWGLWGGISAAPAAVGFTSGSGLRNPLTSGVIAVVEKIVVGIQVSGLTVEWSVGSMLADLATSDVTMGFDGRTPQTGSALHLSHNAVGNGVPGLTPVGQYGVLAANAVFDIILDTDHQFPLLPGFGCEIRCLTANTPINISWKWRDRPIEESERT